MSSQGTDPDRAGGGVSPWAGLVRLPWDLPRLGLALLIGSEGHPWTELGNRLAAYRTFRRGPSDLPLGEALARVAGQPPGERLWLAEGAAYRWARYRRRRQAPVRLGDAGSLPDGLLVAVHSGAGLALAVEALEVASSRGIPVEAVLESLSGRTRFTALPGWEGSLPEALGLAAGTLHPHRAVDWGRRLEALDPEQAALYWHGAGRALYFAPTVALPYGNPAVRSLERAVAEAPGEEARDAMVAGVSWALTLVNLADPAVLAGLLAHLERCWPGEDRRWNAVRHGVAAAALIWWRSAGEDEVLRRFLEPGRSRDGADPAVPSGFPDSLVPTWRNHVTAPVRRLLANRTPGSVPAPWGFLYRCRLLQDLPNRLWTPGPDAGARDGRG